MKVIFILAVALLFFGSLMGVEEQIGQAQVTTGATKAPKDSPQPNPSPSGKDNTQILQRENDAQLPTQVYGGRNYLTQPEFFLSIIVAVVGLAVLLLEFLLLRRNSIFKAEDALRIFGITLILIGALLATTAGYSANDIAPAIGLFGTVAGYLLGRSSNRSEVKSHDKS